MTSRERPPLLVIGIGNEMRRDDGIGVAAIAALAAAPRCRDDVELLALDGEATRLVEAWRGRHLAVVVDAVRSGAPPGVIHRIEVGLDPLPAYRAVSHSSHAVGLSGAVALADALDAMPDHLVVLGVEAGDLGHGPELSAAVVASMAELVHQVRRELAGHAAGALPLATAEGAVIAAGEEG